MKKAIVVLLLLLVIAGSFAFVFLRIQANGSENNFFNTSYREIFAANETLRKILGLHFDGDGKADYLSPKYSKINIEVDEMSGLDISRFALDTLVSRMQAITGKQVTYTINDTAIPFSDNLNETQIQDLANLYRNEHNSGDTASVYLLYLTMEDNDTDRLGVTLQEYGMVLFQGPLELFTKSSPNSLPDFIESTALHEFGHQLGLPHNDYQSCLMQASVDAPSGFDFINGVVTDFCPYERDLIESAKLKF
jgi:hypothetical protein